jgi:hypothetical protein
LAQVAGVADQAALAVKAPAPVRRSVARALGEVLSCLPALMLAWLCLRLAETWHAAGGETKVAILFGPALANNVLSLLRYGFLFVLGAPLLSLIPTRRRRVAVLGALWSVLLTAHAGLLQYHSVAGVPLGGGWRVDPPLPLALAFALAVLWAGLSACERDWWPRAGVRRALVAAAASLLAFAFPPGDVAPTAAPAPAKGELPWAGANPRYPFLHPERTPDTLGPLLERRADTPPNLVFIIVEGLGRNFSGPGARLGSFTPFLDELAGRSLYFENFLSGQGRSFGVLGTVFGSLPFGEMGLAALGDKMPRHASLLSVLKSQGYRLKFYSGSKPAFDNEGSYLRRQGVDDVVSERDDGAPSVAIVLTASMHDPFTFPERPRYLEKVGQRLAQLGIAADANAGYAAQREIFASILYTDDALRRYFEGASKLPGYDNTIFIITGDHRLPELPMHTRIERYHVPLIVFSPLLKAPRAIKAVSSQFDIAPSLLAYLSNNYGLRSPPDVTWLGTGLDTEPAFRNQHVVPLKQTRTELSDFVSGSVYLAQGRLYALADGMLTDRAHDDKALAAARTQFQGFLQANGVAAHAPALAPPDSVGKLAPYRARSRSLRSVALAAEGGGVGVSGIHRAAAQGRDGETMIEATLSNQSTSVSRPFVPLLVLSDAGRLAIGETAGTLQTLEAGASLKVALPARLGKLPHGTYYISVLPSHPETGRSIGIGQYHVEMRL